MPDSATTSNSPYVTGQWGCACGESVHQPRFVAITGGPGAGKTAVLELAARTFCSHVGVLPEAAGIIFGGGFPRSAHRPVLASAQRAIYHVQRELESIVSEQRSLAVALCDRGTVDGLAYWPGSSDEYWASLGTSAEAELMRYQAVIHLRTPAASGGYNRDNVLRIETAEVARQIDDKILGAWDAHPNRTVIECADEFIEKAQRALGAIRQTLPPCCHTHPLAPSPDSEGS